MAARKPKRYRLKTTFGFAFFWFAFSGFVFFGLHF
jgi:hypothetical protein